jgi:hypothetical protein
MLDPLVSPLLCREVLAVEIGVDSALDRLANSQWTRGFRRGPSVT